MNFVFLLIPLPILCAHEKEFYETKGKNKVDITGTTYYMYEEHCRKGDCRSKYCHWTRDVLMRLNVSVGHERKVNRYNPAYYCGSLSEIEMGAVSMGGIFLLSMSFLILFWLCLDPLIYCIKSKGKTFRPPKKALSVKQKTQESPGTKTPIATDGGASITPTVVNQSPPKQTQLAPQLQHASPIKTPTLEPTVTGKPDAPLK